MKPIKKGIGEHVIKFSSVLSGKADGPGNLRMDYLTWTWLLPSPTVFGSRRKAYSIPKTV